MDPNTVLALPTAALASSATTVTSPIRAVYATPPPMAQEVAGSSSDPRAVVTPIHPFKTYLLLSKFGIFDEWAHIVDGLTHGFNIGIQHPPSHTLIFPNHASSKIDTDFINSYICAEEAAGRYSTSFLPHELEALIGPFRTSPIGLVPKPNLSKLRMIQDLSYPRNNPTTPSVNSLINSNDFPTSWGCFNSTSEMILKLPAGCTAATFDISSAYRLTPILPAQQNWACISWNDHVWVDRAVMFGMSSSAGVFGAVADMLVAIYESAGFGPISKWVDDFLVIRQPTQHWSEGDFVSLTADIGVPWSLEKLRKLSTVQRYIGFDWHLDEKAVSFPLEKSQKLQTLINHWLDPGARFTCKQASSLHGKLVHASCIYPLIRPFLLPIALFAARFTSPRAHLYPTNAVTSALSRIRTLLPLLPTKLPLSPPTPFDFNWWGDASTSFGIGIVVKSHWAVWRWAPGVKIGPHQARDIGWAEAVAIELGLRMLLALNLAQPGPFLVRSDNMGVVSIVNSGKSRSAATNLIIQHIHLLLAPRGMYLKATYVTS